MSNLGMPILAAPKYGNDIKPRATLQPLSALQIGQCRLGDTFLLRNSHGFSRIARDGRCASLDLDKHYGIAINSDQIQFAVMSA